MGQAHLACHRQDPSPAASRLRPFLSRHIRCQALSGFSKISGLAPYTLIHPVYQLNKGTNFLNLINKNEARQEATSPCRLARIIT